MLTFFTGTYYRSFVNDTYFDESCTFLITLGNEYRNGRLDMKWFLETKTIRDQQLRSLYKDVLNFPIRVHGWEDVPGATPTMWGNRVVWVHTLDLDRDYYTARTWSLPCHSSPEEVESESTDNDRRLWDRAGHGDIAVSLQSLETIKSYKWKDLASLPQLGVDVLPIQRFQQASKDRPLGDILPSTGSVMGDVVCTVITDLACQWYALLFETILSEPLTLKFITAYLLLAVWDVDLEISDFGGAVGSGSFPTWPTIRIEDQTSFWFRGVLVVAVLDMENKIQRSEAISRACSAHAAASGASGSNGSSTVFALLMSAKHLMTIEFGQTECHYSDYRSMFTDEHTKVIQNCGAADRVFGRAPVDVLTVETLINVFHRANALTRQSNTANNRLLNLPPELRKAVFDLLDRKSFASACEALPTLWDEYWYHRVFNGNQRIAAVAHQHEGYEPLRRVKLRFENDTNYRKFQRLRGFTRRRYLLKFFGCDSGLAYVSAD
ncbi:MAG: hypothetical protein M1812_005186 [Candelaria pacifica]|nr:MAG: hypothetical protein M1812_005186 [Candelaria pacifica]